MAEQQGEIAVTRAAQILGVSAETVRSWAQRTIAAAAAPESASTTKLRYARRDPVGRYYVSHAEILGLKGTEAKVGEMGLPVAADADACDTLDS